MRNKRYDVVVVGCGPGGAVAAKFAAISGAETLIIEQKRQIGFPVHDFMAILYSKSEIEETTRVQIEPAAIYSRAEGVAYVSPSGKEGKPQLLPDGIFTNRQLFEKSLAIAAIRAGAELMLHTRVIDLVREQGAVKGVIIRSGSETITIPCSLVIAADGSYQQMVRLAGIGFPRPSLRTISAAIGCEFAGVQRMGGQHDKNLCEIYLGDFAEGFYAGVVPYADDRISLGITFFPSLAKQRKDLKQKFADLIKHLETIGRYDFGKASPVSMLGSGTLTGPPAALAADGIMLVGDAAGRPPLGCRWGTSGMFQAAWTGRAVGETAGRAIKKGDVSGASLDGEYQRILDDSFKGEKAPVLNAMAVWREIITLNPEAQDRAVAEIGQEIATLHFYFKGALPLRSCLEPVQSWLKENKGR